MQLRGIKFGHVWCASGARNFDPSISWWYHPWLKPIGLDYTGSTFQAKTTTLNPRAGNMPLTEDGLTPKDRMPACILVKPFKGVALNAVGLSGPGAQALLDRGMWQKQSEPLVLSFMSVETTAEDRKRELEKFCELLKAALPDFRAPVALTINFSCPNVGLKLMSLHVEVMESLTIAGTLGIPLIAKFNAMLPALAAEQIERHPDLDAICMSNTLPWGSFPKEIDWKDLFGTDVSPLAHLGGGGLSGKPLKPIVQRWIQEARRTRIKKPIIACGGILSPSDAIDMLEAGATAVEIGSMSFLRPWNVQRTIRAVHAWYKQHP